MPRYVSAKDLINLGWNPKVVTNDLIEDLNATLVEFNIIKPERIRHFISQATHECDYGNGIIEYDDGERYKDREDLGNKYPGDGPKYRGSGAIHLTGRYNYQRFANYVKDQRVMEGCRYVAAKYPWRSGGFFWDTNGLNALVDRGASVKDITRVVNGGYTGLDKRQALYKRAVELKIGLPIMGFNAKLRLASQGESPSARFSDSFPYR